MTQKPGLDEETAHKIHVKKLWTIKKQEMNSQMTSADRVADLWGLRYKNGGLKSLEGRRAFKISQAHLDEDGISEVSWERWKTGDGGEFWDLWLDTK